MKSLKILSSVFKRKLIKSKMKNLKTDCETEITKFSK